MDLLKSRTYLLANNSEINNGDESTQVDIIQSIPVSMLALEISLLPSNQKLVENGDMQVFYATEYQIPWMMQEIGRIREISFRNVGEGTGNDIDIDRYDTHYIQLFIRNKKKKELVGGYRLGLSDEITDKFGVEGLYSYSLFKFDRSFLKKLPPAIELGRSFVRLEYQRSFMPLMMLWKGIAKFVYRYPKYCILFGPVSISNNYCSASQRLLIKFLRKDIFAASLSKQIKARNPYKIKKMKYITIPNINNMTIDNLSILISSLEEDEKGVPVLIRQYIKLGGKMLGFNVDAKFADCIDGLILVDLRKSDVVALAKYMGKEQVQNYLQYHQDSVQQVG